MVEVLSGSSQFTTYNSPSLELGISSNDQQFGAAAKGILEPANDNPSPLRVPAWFIEAPSTTSRNVQLAFKRAIDISVSGLGLVFLLPVLLFVAFMIRMETRGSPVFRQIRVGRNGKLFKILKFRSMYIEHGDPSGVVQTTLDDSRITRLGHALRKTNLDELPQLWNVLVGDMSLVGPRPHVANMVAAGRPYDELVIGYDYRHLMRPGLTGLAQSQGLRGPTVQSWKATRRIFCDVEYVKNFSIGLDARIIVKTLVNEMRGGTGS